jgi:3-phosphoshikimate 1-carboxyvinyltransferase
MAIFAKVACNKRLFTPNAQGCIVESVILAAPRPKSATVSLPGDKSISHRAFLIGAIACGSTRIVEPNVGNDVSATIRALRTLGVPITRTHDGYVVRGTSELAAPRRPINCQNSGTTMRLLAGILAGRVNAILDGDASLRKRPMLRVAEPLHRMGAVIECAPGGRPPLRIFAGHNLRGARLQMRVPSAQVLSAILLAALRASGETTIVSPAQTRDHTQRMLREFGARVRGKGRTVAIRPGALVSPGKLNIPGDLSAAVYFICAGAVLPGCRLRLRCVGINPTRTAILGILRRMGVQLTIRPLRRRGAEPAADLLVKGGAPLRCVPVPVSIIAQIIDEIPALCALAASARGTLRIRGARELRYKESDRIKTIAAMLRHFGVKVKVFPDGITVNGGSSLRSPARVSTYGDHRIGMATAALAAAARARVTISNAACLRTSFPGFVSCWREAF